MAQPDIIRGTYFVLMHGDGGGPETFVPQCGITTRDFTGQVNTTDVFTRDCADPVNVPVRRVIATGKQFDLSGNGVLNRALLAEANITSRSGWSASTSFRKAAASASAACSPGC
jgi:hypothetical protein